MNAAAPVPRGRPGKGSADPARPVPATVAVLGGIVLVEAAALTALGLWWCVQLLRGSVENPAAGVFLVVCTAAVAVVLVASVRALRAGRRIGRAPVATWQLLQGATAVALLPATGWWGLWGVLAASVVVFLLLLTRPVVEHTVPQA